MIQKIFKKLSKLCFIAMWIPFLMIMVNLPFIGENPEMVYGAPKEISLWLILTVGIALAGFFFMIAGIISEAISNKHILSKGQSIKAKIISVKDTKTRINNNPVLEFTLEVKTPDQGTFKTEAQKLVSIADLTKYEAGAMIEVKYIPGTQRVAIA